MIVTALQMDIEWAKPTINARNAEQMILSQPASDLYVLPEMWSTGFATQPDGIAERNEESLEWMKRMACQTDAAIAGSIATEVSEGDFRNRFYFIKPDGTMAYYDKHHLFTYGGEDKHYKAGESRVVVDYKGLRLLLLVCYDLRFPMWSRNNEDYDAILYVASWPTPRLEAWQTLLRARAIENQCYVVGVNRIGSDPACRYSGGTAIIDAYGHALKECRLDTQECITARLDMDVLMSFREKFPVLKDRDKGIVWQGDK